MLRQFGPSKTTVVDCYFGPLKKMVVDRPKLRLGTVTLDHKNVNNKKIKITKIAVKVVVNTTVGQLGAV